MPTKSAPNKQPPYILLWMARLFIIFTAAITGTILIARAARTGYNCLLINGYHETHLLDVPFGTHIPISGPPDAFRADGIYWPSPDGHYVAQFEPGVNVAAASVHLTIRSYKPPIPAGEQWDLISYRQTVDTSINEASWSPDSQWIAYHWQTPDGINYLAVQDASGKYQQTRQLQTQANEAIQFNAWSPDSRFIAVLNRDDNTRTVRISFWSIPDLQEIDPGIYGQRVNSGCSFPSTTYDIYCTYWSPDGHRVAYSITDDLMHFRLVILTPGDRSVRVFDLSSDLQTIRWSPDGRYVAAASLNYAAYPFFAANARLAIFGIDGNSMPIFADAQVVGGGCVGCPWQAEYAWSSDGKAITGVRPSKYNPGNVDVDVYWLETRQHNILASIGNGVINFAISPSRQLAVLLVSGKDARLLSLDGSLSRQLDFGSPYPEDVSWSPDGALFAIYDRNENANYDMVAISDGAGHLVRTFTIVTGILGGGLVWSHCD